MSLIGTSLLLIMEIHYDASVVKLLKTPASCLTELAREVFAATLDDNKAREHEIFAS
jgi:hypothetical protein